MSRIRTICPRDTVNGSVREERAKSLVMPNPISSRIQVGSAEKQSVRTIPRADPSMSRKE